MPHVNVNPGDRINHQRANDVSLAAFGAVPRDEMPISGARNGVGAKPCLMLNASGATVLRHQVLGIGDALFNPATNEDQFSSRVSFRGVAPSFEAHQNRFGILDEPALADQIVRAHVSGVCHALVDIQSEGDTHAGLVAGAMAGDPAHLASGTSGPVEILYAEPGTGEKLATVRFGSSPGIMPVTLATDGGLAGTSSGPCTYTYTATAIVAGGPPLATGLSPVIRRPPKGAQTGATFGYLHRDASGILALGWCNEGWLAVQECPE